MKTFLYLIALVVVLVVMSVMLPGVVAVVALFGLGMELKGGRNDSLPLA